MHRFYQMYQQLDCGAAAATDHNGSGCLADLFPWVEVSVGAGSNGAAPPAGFNDDVDRRRLDLDGLLQRPARRRALSEGARRHLLDERQLSSGGEGRHGRQPHHAGHRRCDLVQRRQGQAATPPQHPVNPADPGTTVPGYANALSEIENPNPQPGTNNYYIQDGYGGGPDRLRPAPRTPVTAAAPTSIAPTRRSPASRPY